MRNNPSSPLSLHPSALLLLLTGIPAAGKSTFLAAAQRHVLQGDNTSRKVPLFGGRCQGRICSVLQLDKVLADLEAATAHKQHPVAPAGERKFSPLLWRQATRRLLELTQSALRTCITGTVNGDAREDAVVPMVLVEDNMHYRSMRERYYQMCRSLEREVYYAQTPHDSPTTSAQSRQPFIVLFELRFATPLAVCLARNARRGKPQEGAGKDQACESAWVPPPVICSMDALFDHCYARTDRVNPAAGEPCRLNPWQWTTTTQPWGLLVHATQAVETDESWPAVLPETAVSFFDVALQQSEAWDACQRQCQEIACTHLQRLREDEDIDEATRRRRAAETALSHAHRLDLQLRGIVHAFLSQRNHWKAHGTESVLSTPQGAALFRKSIAAAKQEAAQRFRVQLRQLGTEKNEPTDTIAVELLGGSIDDLQELVVQEFQQRVLDLWRDAEVCVLPTPHTQ
ncbi:conserved hypothetical protein [Leishmania braziliensis MHOM/BR/75/M2904]|uniref:Uncharacterized protein n=2 Tax=Leishmania braziliensis TaxID=5660 RepID=A4HQ70_LEIBR|nr:conserved hypothetical protein [Leishmania braziliensis MHOM/BR/75/M2904]KAI5691611.1 hypothetical protein MNV84_08335 [Leishmania braziliensis]CAJ2482100.1 unnamed protein product [Leishmania braziliensis]CAJ2482463.1 unnamed protein product [Leishmania braziliensis]CAM44334.1 conserved hypothetical protein [Leishmania braziliensis MHOM/BR/75/M2904]SYZ70410.1 hypothetical_protein [Leishmania braziliensis MHOM/BR/75/M2904]